MWEPSLLSPLPKTGSLGSFKELIWWMVAEFTILSSCSSEDPLHTYVNSVWDTPMLPVLHYKALNYRHLVSLYVCVLKYHPAMKSDKSTLCSFTVRRPPYFDLRVWLQDKAQSPAVNIVPMQFPCCSGCFQFVFLSFIRTIKKWTLQSLDLF